MCVYKMKGLSHILRVIITVVGLMRLILEVQASEQDKWCNCCKKKPREEILQRDHQNELRESLDGIKTIKNYLEDIRKTFIDTEMEELYKEYGRNDPEILNLEKALGRVDPENNQLQTDHRTFEEEIKTSKNQLEITSTQLEEKNRLLLKSHEETFSLKEEFKNKQEVEENELSTYHEIKVVDENKLNCHSGKCEII